MLDSTVIAVMLVCAPHSAPHGIDRAQLYTGAQHKEDHYTHCSSPRASREFAHKTQRGG